jgi:hypothetical protein
MQVQPDMPVRKPPGPLSGTGSGVIHMTIAPSSQGVRGTGWEETYLWTVTRYVHKNSVRAGMVEQPAAWARSSYPGFSDRGWRLSGVGRVRRAASVLTRCVRRVGPGGGLAAESKGRIVRASGFALDGGIPRLDPRESRYLRSGRGDGAWRTAARAATDRNRERYGVHASRG